MGLSRPRSRGGGGENGSGRATDATGCPGRDRRRDRRVSTLAVGTKASSTALDTVLFVLLVGAAVGVLATVHGGGSTGDDRVAPETADVLATSTTNVSYTQSFVVEGSALLGPDDRTVSVERDLEGTYAELLAGAVTATPTVAGKSLVASGGHLRRETRAVTRYVLPTREANVQVRAVWRPYVGAPVDSLVVGERPPDDADVSVATLSVPSGFPNVSAAARRGARSDGYRGVAVAVADGVIEGLFPPAQTRTALYSEGPDAGVVAGQYSRAADALDVDLGGLLGRRDVAAANGKLADALAGRLVEKLMREFDSPVAAARAVSVDRVRVVVRTWSP